MVATRTLRLDDGCQLAWEEAGDPGGRLNLPNPRIPVQIWHGEMDPASPVAIPRFFERVLPCTEVRTFAGEGHVSVFVHHRTEIVGALRAALHQRRTRV